LARQLTLTAVKALIATINMIDTENFLLVYFVYKHLSLFFFYIFSSFFFWLAVFCAGPSLIKPPYGIFSGGDYQRVLRVGGQGFYI